MKLLDQVRHTARVRRKQGATRSFVPQRRAETAKPNVARGVSAKEVNSDQRAVREEEEFLQISQCAPLTGRP